MTGEHPPAFGPQRSSLSVWDAVSLLVGIVVGTAIFEAPQAVFSGTHSPLEALGLWVIGGGLAFAGALCYGELAAAYPRSGGDYEYLGQSYGRWLGLQFATAQLLIVLTGSVGSMAFVFADYCRQFTGGGDGAGVWLALGAILALTIANLMGLRTGRTTQNGLTLLKLAGLGVIVLLGLMQGDWSHLAESSAAEPRSVGFAMILIFYAYAGWTHAAYVAAEVDHPQRNLPRALLAGVAAVTVIYLLVNLAYALVLGFEGARGSNTPAADVMQATIGPAGARLFSLLVMLSALGAINGTILSGAFVLAELGRDYRRLDWLTHDSAARSAPVVPLLLESGVACGLVLLVGTELGRGTVDRFLMACRLPAVPWEQYHGGFATLVAASGPLFWFFLLLSGTTVFILRWKEPGRPRPFRTPGYPLTPLLFCGTSLYMLYASVSYAGSLTWIGLLPVAAAGIISWVHRRER